jgi:hypothetical protein
MSEICRDDDREIPRLGTISREIFGDHVDLLTRAICSKKGNKLGTGMTRSSCLST